MRAAFPFPLPESALGEFCHPAAGHALARPMRRSGEILVGNGYLAMIARKGNWIDAEFPEATPEFMARLEKLRWGRLFEVMAHSEAWDALDRMRGTLGRHGPLEVWNAGRIHACPIWRVRDALVRLSMLQLVARLPRAEVYTGQQALPEDGMMFRFSGGCGIVARDARLTHGTFEIFQPRADVFESGRVMERSRGKSVGFAWGGSMANWPPVDETESDGHVHGIDFL